MPDMALRFILNNPDVSTIIPGMRKVRNVEANIAASDAGPQPDEVSRPTAPLPLGPPADGVVTVESKARQIDPGGP